MNFYSQLASFLNNYLIRNKLKKKFKKLFKSDDIKGRRIILIEFNHWPIFHIAGAYLTYVISKKYPSKIIGFYNNCYIDNYLEINVLKKIKIFILQFLNLRNFGIYKSFNVKKILYPNLNKNQKIIAKKKFLNISKKIKNKSDILSIKINNINIGDLLYDSFLKRYSLATIDINSYNFRNYLKLFIYLFIYWDFFFKKNNVKSLIVSHSVYSTAIPLRIAINNGIKCYVPNTNYLYALSKKRLLTDLEYLDFKMKFLQLNHEIKKKSLLIAKNSLLKRFKGSFSKDIYYSKNLSFKNINYNKIKFDKNKFNVLIAAHSFSDSPHIYGDLLFNDFYEWLIFLGHLSKKTEYNWYIKDGPDYPLINEFILNQFTINFPNIKLLPRNCSHHLLVKNIDLVLTCYGTIAHEYPYFNVPVINASKNNPHKDYKFSIHPKNILDYKIKILQAKKLKIKINKNEIFEFYYMKYKYYKIGWCFNLENFLNKYGYKIFIPNLMYNFWMKSFSEKKHKKILDNLSKFIDNKDYIFQIKD